MIAVYVRVEGKLAKYHVETDCPDAARQAVIAELGVSTAAFAVIPGGKDRQ